MKHRFTNLWPRSAGSTNRGPRSGRSRRLKVEPLEQRTLLAVYYVDDVDSGGAGTIDDPFGSIQDGIDAAAANEGPDTVMIAPGDYVENLTIDDPAPLTLQGTPVSVVTAEDGAENTIDVNAVDVTIRQLTISGGRNGIMATGEEGSLTVVDVDAIGNTYVELGEDDEPIAGLNCDKLGEVTIIRGNYSGNGALEDVNEDHHGIYLTKVDVISADQVTAEGNGERGFYCKKGSAALIKHVNFSNNPGDGFKSKGTDNMTIIGGMFQNNDDGLDIEDIDLLVVRNVTARGNGDEGLEVDESDEIQVIGGKFSYNEGDGLDLDNSTSISVRNVVSMLNGKHGLQIEAETQSVENVSIVRSVFSHNAESGVSIVEVEPEEGEEAATIDEVFLCLLTGVMNGDNGLEIEMADTSNVTAKKLVFVNNGGDDVVGI